MRVTPREVYIELQPQNLILYTVAPYNCSTIMHISLKAPIQVILNAEYLYTTFQ